MRVSLEIVEQRNDIDYTEVFSPVAKFFNYMLVVCTCHLTWFIPRLNCYSLFAWSIGQSDIHETIERFFEGRNVWFVICLNSCMDLSKVPDNETNILMSSCIRMISYKVHMTLVCT